MTDPSGSEEQETVRRHVGTINGRVEVCIETDGLEVLDADRDFWFRPDSLDVSAKIVTKNIPSSDLVASAYVFVSATAGLQNDGANVV